MPVEPPNDVLAHQQIEDDLRRRAETAQLLLDAARYLGETLELERVYDRFHELLADTIQHDGVVVSSFDEHEGLIRAEYVWVEGEHVNPGTLPELKLSTAGGMQSEVIRTGKPLLENDVGGRVAGDEGGTFYDVDRDGTVRKLPDTGPTHVQAAMMVPVKHEGRVVGVVQLMSDERTYTEEDLELLEGLAGLMGAAVRMARLQAERLRAEAAEAAAKAVAEEREQAARLFEAVGDGIFFVRHDGVIRFWNRSAELILGLPSEDVSDRPAAEVVPGWQAIADQVSITEGDSVARVVQVPVEVGGRELWLSFVAVGRPEGVVYAFRDLTAERELEDAKSDFIATISHELRTPMTAVYGAARTLLRPELEVSPDQVRELLEMIATQSERLAQITEEVLLASRLDRGEVTVEHDRVDVAELARETIAALDPRLGGKVSIDAPEAAFAIGDRDRISQILINLLDNADTYSSGDGAITVSVSETPDRARLAVTDRGIGIAPGEQQAIFEKFYRADPHLTETPGGTGLGLYICRELAERMEGRITVESEPGLGSTFVLELPRG
jgi:PAS domain S-box-containing protein